MQQSASSSAGQWTILLILTALLLSLVVCLQIITTFTSAYVAAPRQVATFVDAVDSSIQENESYDAQVARVSRLEDKMRLGRLLREIQKNGDELREILGGLLISDEDPRIKSSARLVWCVKRRELEDKVRRLDMLRMRFLVVYMGILAAANGAVSTTEIAAEKGVKKAATGTGAGRDAEKMSLAQRLNEEFSARPQIPRAVTDAIKQRPPLRRLTTQAIGHNESIEGAHKTGWAGVVRELQLSPRMHKRHASIENALSRATDS